MGRKIASPSNVTSNTAITSRCNGTDISGNVPTIDLHATVELDTTSVSIFRLLKVHFVAYRSITRHHIHNLLHRNMPHELEQLTRAQAG